MIRYRHNLPQLSGDLFLTDGGLETTLIFHDGIDLPCFAAFDLLKSEAGTQSIQEYIRPYLHLARSKEVGFILESATWRANADWGLKLGYSAERLDAINRQAIAMLFDLRDEFETGRTAFRASALMLQQKATPNWMNRPNSTTATRRNWANITVNSERS